MRTLVRELLLAAPAVEVWAYHLLPTTLRELSPSSLEDLQPTPVVAGGRVTFRFRLGPLRIPWVSRYSAVEPPAHLAETTENLPFRTWEHHHWFLDRGPHCLLRDEVRVAAPAGALGDALCWPVVRRLLDTQFDHHHAVLRKRFGTP